MDKYECTICGYIYDEAEGDADNGIAAGTKLLIFRKIGYVRPAVLTKVPSRRWTNAAMKAVASAAAFFLLTIS